jgi:tetratricopeptide (TPR) repeat protein
MRFQASGRFLVMAAAAVAVVALSAAGFFGYPKFLAWRADRSLLAAIRANKDATTAYDAIQTAERDKVKNVKNAGPYIEIGNEWGLIADLLRNQDARDRAIAEYERGIVATDQKNSILILNAGNAYRAAGRFTDAEAKYRLAIQIDPGNPLAYEKLIELYRIDLKKPPEAIIPVFQQALEKLVENSGVIQELAEYLAYVGRYQDALRYYELLAKKYPDQFNPVITDIRAKIAASSTAPAR